MAKEVEDIENTRVLVRLGDFEVEIEGTQRNVSMLMGETLFSFIRNLQNIVENVSLETPEIVSELISEDIPQILKQSTFVGTLRKLFTETEWGQKPRTLQEIMTVLETNGLYYSKQSASRRLLDLLKKGDIRRLGSRGNYRYVAA